MLGMEKGYRGLGMALHWEVLEDDWLSGGLVGGKGGIACIFTRWKVR